MLANRSDRLGARLHDEQIKCPTRDVLPLNNDTPGAIQTSATSNTGPVIKSVIAKYKFLAVDCIAGDGGAEIRHLDNNFPTPNVVL